MRTMPSLPIQRLRLSFVAPLCWLALALVMPARAQLIFDVFVGHGLGVSDSVVAEAAWFPVTCEIQNDGPGFNGIVEISGGQFGGGQVRRVALELPTGTKKRFSVPFYCTSRHRVSVDAVLLNEKGTKVLAERRGVEARTVADWQSPLLASLSRSHGGAASLPEGGRNSPYRPVTTHVSPELLPDNPLVWESISMLYLHSARVAELKPPQARALVAWLHGGGHLVVAVEQPGEVNGADWLASLLPCVPGGVTVRKEHSALQAWLQAGPHSGATLKPRVARKPGQTKPVENPFPTLPSDPAFESAELPAVSATVRDGKILAGTAEAPLVVQAPRGRGTITVLLFSPELEPCRSWKNRPWLWARLADVPHEWLADGNVGQGGTMVLDGAFGAMVDSRQVRKLPVGWLLLLLVAYLVVIGPLDRFWLKKLNRQVLTWLTFPAYVALFSLLIYFIGYKLRSGEMEWNELHVVDVTPRPGGSDWRGRVFGSAYSPANARYAVASETGFSTLRGEMGQGGAQEISRARVEQRGHGFAARLEVPVWTSQLFVNDWWRPGQPPVTLSLKSRGQEVDVTVENPLGKRIPSARLILDGRVHELGDISRGVRRTLNRAGGQRLQEFVQGQVVRLNTAAQQRQQQFGSGEDGRLGDAFTAATAASFLAVATVNADPAQPWAQNQYWSRFVTPPGFDLSPLLERDQAVLLAWMPGETLVPPLNQFTPRYSRRDTLVRVAAPLER